MIPMIDDKKRLIKLIHVAKKNLNLDDETYRDALELATGQWSDSAELLKPGKRSAAKLTLKELNAVLAHFKTKGFKPTRSKVPSGQALDNSPQSQKIRRLWLELHQMGAVRNSSEQALVTYVKRQSGVSVLDHLSVEQASKVIEHLKQWQNRLDSKGAKAHG